MDSDDDMPTLSAATLAALQSFKNEEKERIEKFSKLYEQAEDEFDNREKLSIDDFKEDWQLSQFWYSDKTAEILLDSLLENATKDSVICIVSAPSVYAIINKRDLNSLPTKNIYLFEFDKRFELLSGKEHFGFYDYNKPTEFREDLKGKVDILLIDPPFLEVECQKKSSETAKLLLKDYKKSKLITCTGERMKENVLNNYPGIHVTDFHPEHKNGLSNEFRCYANFECKQWKKQSEVFLNVKNGLRINEMNDIKNDNINTNTNNSHNHNRTDDDDDMNDSSNWLSNFDPPLNEDIALNEMTNAFKKISNDVLNNNKAKNIMIHSSPYNRCIQTSELLLDKIKKNNNNNNKDNSDIKIKLRVDQALSEWLNENYNLKYLPPNDDGYSMINNVNAYLNQPKSTTNNNNSILTSKTKDQLRNIKDFTWSYNQLGHCGEYGESASEFTKRCFNYLINLLQYYYTKQTSESDKEMVVFIISHGAVISTILQILLGCSIFNEIPLCSPIYFKQSTKRRSVFKLMDYDFNLNKLLTTSSDKEFFKILETPIDLTKLNSDNLRSELTIGTTGYTTIIQSIPKNNINKENNSNNSSENNVKKNRRRRNTINIGDKEKGFKEDNEKIESLKYTRSSKQLYLLNKDTSDEKVIDLEKLHSYFSGGDSDDDDDEDEDDGSG
ncbi:hypothetical protein C6P42_003394, partial [Pichia californica]